MVTIADDELNVTVSADTERLALRQMAKARRAAAKAQQIKNANQELARVYARAAGFRVYDRMAEGKDFPCGWSFAAPESSWFPKHRADDDFPTLYEIYTFDTDNGKGDWKIYREGWKVVGVVEDGNGSPFILFLADLGSAGEGEPVAYAIGVYGGEVCLERFSGKISTDLFRHFKH